jgi:hypothetical protein
MDLNCKEHDIMVKLNELTSRECGEYVKNGGNLIFVPAASPERLGPHLPVGARGMITEIIADKLAEYHNGLSLPLIPYTTVYDDFDSRGSIDIEPQLVNRYLTELCNELTANKLRRIVFVTYQTEIYYLCNEYFQEKHIAVAALSPEGLCGQAESKARALDRHGKELWLLAACLRLNKNQEMLDKIFEKTRKYFGMKPPENKQRDILRMFGDSGYKTYENEWRFYPANLCGSLPGETEVFELPGDKMLDAAALELEIWLKSFDAPLAALTTYQGYLDENPFVRLF